MPHVRYLLACTGTAVLGCGMILSAQTVPPSPATPSQQITSTVAGRAAQGQQTILRGAVLDSDGSPLANSSVRLRNLKTHQVDQVSVANQNGEFSFTVQPQIPYVVEIADNAGQIIAVGDVVVVQAGEAAGLLVSAPVRLSAMAGVFRDTAASVLSAVAGTGLTAFGSVLTPATPAPPASPEK